MIFSNIIFIIAVLLLLPLHQNVVVDAQEEASATVQVNADGSSGAAAEADDALISTCQKVCLPQVAQAIAEVNGRRESCESSLHKAQKEAATLAGERDGLQSQLTQTLQEWQGKLETHQIESEIRIADLQKQVVESQSHAEQAKNELTAAHETHKTAVAETKQSLESQLADANKNVARLEQVVADVQEQLRLQKASRFHLDIQGIFQDLMAMVKGKSTKA